MVFTFQPFVRKWAHKAGSVWRSLAATALLGTNRHQASSSTPPDCTSARNEAGSSGAMALSRFWVSRATAENCASVGAELTTCSKVCDLPRTDTFAFGGVLYPSAR